MTWRVLDGVFFLRPLLLVPVWTFFLLGYGPPRVWPAEVGLWLGLGAITAACSAAFVLNQAFDVESDRHNRKCLFISSGAIPRQAAFVLYALLCVASAGACLMRSDLSFSVGSVLVLGLLYSAPPWSWKDRPYFALLSNLLAHGVAVFACGRVAAGSSLFSALGPSLPYAFGVAAVYLLTTLPDRDGDSAVGKRTLAVTLGPERAARWALGWYLSAVLLALYQVDLIFLLGVLPSFWWFAKAGRGDLTAASKAVRASVLGLSAAAVVLHPWYALVLALGWVVTRTYYQKRWNLTYP